MRGGLKWGVISIGAVVLIVAGGAVWSFRKALIDYVYQEAIRMGMPVEAAMLETDVAPRPEENAAPVIEEIERELQGKRLDGTALFKQAQGTAEERQAARAELAGYSRLLTLAEEAAARPASRYQRDWALGPHIAYSEYAPGKKAVQALSARAVLGAHDGDMAGAAADLETALRLSRHISADPCLISMLVRVSNETIVNRAAEAVAAQAETAADLEPLRSVLAEQADPIPLFWHLRGEITIVAASSRNITNAGDLEDTLDPHDPSFRRTGPPPNAAIKVNLNNFLKRWVPVFGLSDEEKKDNDKVAAAVEHAVAMADSADPVTDTFSATLMPVFGENIVAERRLRAIRATTLAYVDTLAFKLKNGRLPESIEDLPGEYKDPFSEGPLIFLREGDGFRVYSVGANGKDDKGRTYRELNQERTQGDLPIIHPPIPSARGVSGP